MTEPRWLDDRQQRAWRAYLAMHSRLMARLNRELQAESNLSLADFDILVHLTDDPAGRVRVGELASSLQWEKSRMSHQLSRMQRRELVTREECPADGRGAFIVLTARGRAAIEQAAPRHVAAVRELVFDELSDAETEVLADICDRALSQIAKAEIESERD